MDLEGVAAVLADQRLGHQAAGRVPGTHEQHADRSARSWIEVLDVAGHEVHDVLGDVGRAVTDPFEVMRGDDDPGSALDVGRVLAHQLDDLIERGVVQPIDLVVLDRDLARRDGIGVDQRTEDAVDQDAPSSAISGRWT